MMSESNLNEFVNLVLRNLEKNGFPDRSVSFPLEKMYESASQRGFSFNKVRDLLLEQGITTELTEERVIFSKMVAPATGFDMAGLQETAQKILEQMSPEELSQMTRMMQDMSPDELEKIKRQWESMTTEEKERMMGGLQNFTKNP